MSVRNDFGLVGETTGKETTCRRNDCQSRAAPDLLLTPSLVSSDI